MKESMHNALNRRGSYKSVVFNGEENREIGFLINASVENSNIEYYLRIVSPGSIKEEYLKIDGKELIINKEGKVKWWDARTNNYEIISYYGFPGDTELKRNTHHQLQQKFRKILEKIEIYNFDLQKLRQKVKIGKVPNLITMVAT
jgi:hypothetical protein